MLDLLNSKGRPTVVFIRDMVENFARLVIFLENGQMSFRTRKKKSRPKMTLEEIQRIKEEYRLKREKGKELRKQERDKVTFSKLI